MNPPIQIIIGALIIGGCAVGGYWGGIMIKHGLEKKREQSVITQAKDSPTELQNNIKIVRVQINRIIEDSNPWLRKAIEQNNIERDKIKSNFNKRGVFHSGMHILAHIKQVNSFIDLINNYVKKEIDRKIEDLLIDAKEGRFESVTWLKDEYQKYLEFIKASEEAKHRIRQENNEFCVRVSDESTFNTILRENPYRD